MYVWWLLAIDVAIFVWIVNVLRQNVFRINTHTQTLVVNWIWLHSPHSRTHAHHILYMYTTRYIWQSFNFSTLYNQHDKQQKWKISMSCHSCGMCIGSFVEYSKRSEVWIVINQIVQSNIFFGKRVKYICINWSNAALNSLKNGNEHLRIIFHRIARNCWIKSSWLYIADTFKPQYQYDFAR